jgi:NADH dehydrogenase/NADH:ubiquinone oxidoreductase subunit G
VGALTLKVFSDELREWEFIEGEGVDPTDSFGVSLRLSIRENEVFLAEPNDPNMPWITDKARLFFDGMFDKTATKPVAWTTLFNEIVDSMYFIDHLNFQKRNEFSFIIAFENLSLESLNMVYLLEQCCSVIKLRKVESNSSFNDSESAYQLNSSSQKTKLHMSTLGLLLNTNPRHEGYVLNLSLRQRFLKGNFKLLTIGPMLDLTFSAYNLGSNISVLESLGEGTHVVCQDFKNSEFPIFITNTELFKRSDAKIFMQAFKHTNTLNTAWSGLNVLNHSISSVGMQSLNNFLPLSTEDFVNFFGVYYVNVSLNSTSNMKKLTELHLLNVFSSNSSLNNRFFIDQNTKPVNKLVFEKSKTKTYNDYFYLPSSLFLEDSETYVNTQGLIKRTTKLINFKKEAKSSWQIIRKFYSNTKSLMFFNNKKDNKLVRFDCTNSFNFKNYANFQFYAYQTSTSLSFYLTKQNFSFSKLPNRLFKSIRIKLLNTKVKHWLDDFFTGNGKDSFSYNSSVLVNCSKIARSSLTNFF